MRIRPKLRGLWPFSIGIYALGLIAVVLLALSTLIWAVQTKVEAVKREAQMHDQAAAKAELDKAVAHTVTELRRLALHATQGDEIRQQLADPAYYLYWRNYRLLHSAALPSFTRAGEVYDRRGRALAEHPLDNMPQVLAQNPKSFYRREDSSDYLYIFLPILAEENNPSSVQGYVGFKFDFLQALKNEEQFAYIKTDSIRLQKEPYSGEQPRLTYQLKERPERSVLLDIIAGFKQQIVLIFIALSFALFFLLNYLLAVPLRRLSRHIDALGESQGGILPENFAKSLPVAELEKVRQSLNDYQNKLESMNSSLNQKNDELWTLAHHDPLTGIYNRRCFEDDWAHVLSVANGHRLDVAFSLFDCDNFKAINDTYGHDVGDKVIQTTAHLLQSKLRHGDRLYRLGGDEFAAIFLDSDPKFVLQVMERCLLSVSEFDFTAMGVKEPVRISVGLAHTPGTEEENLATLPKQADIALYHAKRPGRPKIAVYDDSMITETDIIFSTRHNHAVFEALASGKGLEIHYQPVVDLGSGAVKYYEALVRIRDGDELLSPPAIFPIIEARRIEVEFDIAIIERITQDITQGSIPRGTGISLNISGPSAVNPTILNLIQTLSIHLGQYAIIVEVTETALITQLHQASYNLNELRKAGFLIALDDFGSGYSSLGYITSMPVDIVKFDISMIRHLMEESRQSIIVAQLAEMLAKTGYQLVAEGIEDENTLEQVKRMGFSCGQGYLFGRPERACRDLAQAKMPV
ncbi:MAG: putative bifunctional diguanylate cyclase/phosphodiesterase [Burkholderiales bacterium]